MITEEASMMVGGKHVLAVGADAEKLLPNWHDDKGEREELHHVVAVARWPSSTTPLILGLSIQCGGKPHCLPRVDHESKRYSPVQGWQ